MSTFQHNSLTYTTDHSNILNNGLSTFESSVRKSKLMGSKNNKEDKPLYFQNTPKEII